MQEEKLELHAIFLGRVQGVGFRWTIQEHAIHLNLLGTVQNLSNGTVEVFLQGAKKDLEKFLATIQKKPEGALIKEVQTHFFEPRSVFSNFKIIF